MAKLFKGLFAIIVSLIVLTPVVSADEGSYEITQMHEDVTINEDGSATINYHLKYSFDDDMNGVYITQATDQTHRIVGQVTATVNGEAVGAYRAGSRYGLESKRTDGATQLRVHYPVSAGHQYEVTWTYQLSQVAQRFQDVGEINWRIIGTNWAVDLHQVKIVLQLPKTDLTTLQAWTHSKNTATTFKTDKQAGQLVYTNELVQSNQPVELHTMFDQDVLSAASQSKQDRRDAIVSEERAIAARAKARGERDKIFQLVVASLFIIPLAILGRFWILWQRKRDLGRTFDTGRQHQYDLPSDLAPAIVGWQLDDHATSNETLFSATMMDLMARRILSVTDTGRQKKREPIYDVRLEKLVDFQPFEETLLIILFGGRYKVGDTIRTSTLRDDDSAFAERYTDKIDRFENQVRRAAQPYTIIDHTAVGQLTHWQTWAILAAVVVMIANGAVWFMSTAYGPLWPMVASLVISLAVVIFGFGMSRRIRRVYTMAGWPIAQDWFNFGRMLSDVGRFDIKEVPDVVLWDRYLAYAVVLGVADKVADTLKQAQAELPDGASSWVPVYVAYAVFTPSHVSGYGMMGTDAASAGSWGAGGTSGGFGGGSGGGAF